MVKYPADWKAVKINDLIIDIADGPFGSNLKAVHYTNKREARIIQLSNLGDDGWKDENVKYTTYQHAREISRSIVAPGNVVMAKMMPAGRTIICPRKEKMYVLSSDVIRMKLDKDVIDTNYFVYSTKGRFFLDQLDNEIQGSTRNRTSITKIKNNAIMLPSLEEQKAIADALTAFDTYIDDLTVLIQKKKDIRDGALEDLVSGRTRLAGFTGEWKHGKLSDFAVINPKVKLPSEFMYVDLESVKENTLVSARKETRRNAPSRAQRLAKQKDIFFQTVRPYQKNNFFFNLKGCYVFSSGYAQIRTEENPYYLFLVVRHDGFVKNVLENCTGTGYPAINPSHLAKIEITIPSDIAEQQAIADTLTAMDEEIRQLEAKRDKLKDIRDGAMDDLLTGRIRLGQ